MRRLSPPSLSLIKFPLFALLCAIAAEAVLPTGAIAGRVPVTPPGAGNAVGDTFSPTRPAPTGTTLAGQINNGVLNALRTIQARNSVATINGKYLFISPSKVDTLTAALSAAEGIEIGERLNLELLEEQIADEMGGLEVDLTLLGTSESEVETAIETTNRFIEGLSREQLMLAINSPTLMALLQLLRAADEAANGSPITVPGGGLVGVMSISLAQ
ncbi:hypothetical protein BH23CYA1_BH23CYA1_05210 [soil metagenome]